MGLSQARKSSRTSGVVKASLGSPVRKSLKIINNNNNNNNNDNKIN